MYVRLCAGKVIKKSEEASKYGVDERTVQRDIDDIRAFLYERADSNLTDTREVIYDRTREGFIMTGIESTLMSNDEILAISKILLESRAFTKNEISSILDKIIAGCVSKKNVKLVTDLILNEKYHYVELCHKASVKGKLWEIADNIKNCNLLEIVYDKQVSTKETVKRVIQPLALIFSEYYFYLIAFIVEKNEKGLYMQKHNYPAVFRVDRILKCREIGEKFKVKYSNRFEEGDFRKKVQFMFPGDLTKIRFRYNGKNVEAILDRLPTAKIIAYKNGVYIIEAEVFGNGILMWLLSQGSAVEVLHPQSMRDEMKRMLMEVMELYKG